ncbi:hypothetical protein XENOCAPTIV_007990 [Xenoophorus captivus]|uniref:PPM-type phosphatase domain-containing protein n=1 Tax=Xenoophorus captivus TaxID=1517983 RepID=A0ABV0SDZ3_9TELE
MHSMCAQNLEFPGPIKTRKVIGHLSQHEFSIKMAEAQMLVFPIMDDSLLFRMSAFSDQGGRKYMEDVIEIRIEYEPTASRDECYPKSQRHGRQGKTENGAAPQTVTEPHGLGRLGPAATAWVESLSDEDICSIGTPASSEKDAAEHVVVDTRRSVAFFAVFDGHGGREAAHFASEHLWDLLKRQRGFWSKDHSEVCAALRKGFVACHHAMWKELRKCSKNKYFHCISVNIYHTSQVSVIMMSHAAASYSAPSEDGLAARTVIRLSSE